jgi:hypothetical protein
VTGAPAGAALALTYRGRGPLRSPGHSVGHDRQVVGTHRPRGRRRHSDLLHRHVTGDEDVVDSAVRLLGRVTVSLLLKRLPELVVGIRLNARVTAQRRRWSPVAEPSSSRPMQWWSLRALRPRMDCSKPSGAMSPFRWLRSGTVSSRVTFSVPFMWQTGGRRSVGSAGEQQQIVARRPPSLYHCCQSLSDSQFLAGGVCPFQTA